MAGASIPPDRDVAKWLQVTRHDLSAIRNLLFGLEPVVTAAAYHCQQAAEKLVKAVLVSEDIYFPKVHDIGVLLNLLPPSHPLRARLIRFEGFTPLAWIYRYPAPGHFGSMVEEPTVDEVTGWLRELEAAVAEIGPLILAKST